MNNIYYLLSNFDGKIKLAQIYYKQEYRLYRIFSQIEKNGNSVDLKLSGDKVFSIDIDGSESLFNEIFSKDEVYSDTGELKEYYYLEEANESKYSRKERIYRPFINDILGTSILRSDQILLSKVLSGGIEINNYDIDTNVLIDSINQLEILISDIKNIFQYVEPSVDNFNTYSSK